MNPHTPNSRFESIASLARQIRIANFWKRSGRFVGIAAAVWAGAITADAQNIPSAGQIAYWNFEEQTGAQAADLSGAGRNLSLAGFAWTPEGISGGAVVFNAPIAVGTYSAPAAPQISIAAWIHPDALPAGTLPRVASSPAYEFMVVANGTSSLLQFEVTHSSENARWRTLPGSILPGSWTHVVATFDGSTARVYLNGQPAALNVFTSPSGTRNSNAGTGRIGNRADLARAFSGRMDDIVLYSRALTAFEVQQMAGATAGVPADSSGVSVFPATAPHRYPDWDADGVVDAVEIFSGTSRTNAQDRPSFTLAPASSGGEWEFSYLMTEPNRHHPTVEISSDLTQWSATGVAQDAASAPAGSGLVQKTARFVTASDRTFARLRVEDTRELAQWDFASVRDLWARMLLGYRSLINASRTYSSAGDGDYQYPTRMAWALGAWFSQPGRPRTLEVDSQSVDVAELVLNSLRNGTDPSHPAKWPLSSTQWGQMVVEAPQVGWALWCLHRGAQGGASGHPFGELSATHLANIHAFLRDQDQSVYPHNWGLFVAANQEVRRQLNLAGVPGFEASWSRTVIDDRLARSHLMHAGEGWYSDSSISPSTPTFDDYNPWGYLLFHLVWLLYTAEEPESATTVPGSGKGRMEMLQEVRQFLDHQLYYFDAHGGHPEFGRSGSYKFARLSALTFAYALERLYNTPDRWNLGFSILPDSLPVGRIRRLLRLHFNHYLQLEIIHPDTGILERGITRESSPELLEAYLTPGSTYWSMSAMAGLWLLPESDPLWSAPEEPLPSESSDYAFWSQPTGFLLSHHAADGHVELFNTRVHKTTGGDLESKYEKFVYSSLLGHTTRSGSRLDNNLSLGTTWRLQPTQGDRWLPEDPDDSVVILRSMHSQGGNTVQTLIFVRDGIHVRVHRLSSGPGASPVREGGYAVGHSAAEPAPMTTSGEDWILHESPNGNAFTARLLGYTSTSESSGSGLHSRSAGWKIGVHQAPSASAGSVFASMYRASRYRFDPVTTRAAVSSVEVAGTTVTIHWGDGTTSTAPFPQ